MTFNFNKSNSIKNIYGILTCCLDSNGGTHGIIGTINGIYTSNDLITWTINSDLSQNMIQFVKMNLSNALVVTKNNTSNTSLIYYSSNKGTTYTNSTWSYGDIQNICMNHTNAIALSDVSGIYYSTNTGQSWNLSDIIGSFTNVCINDSSDAIVNNSLNNGIYYSNNAGKNWSSCIDVSNIQFNNIYMNGQNAIAAVNYYGTSLIKSGLYYSNNAGQTWTSSADVSNINFNSVCIDGSNCIAISDVSGLYYSNNAGQTWTKSNILVTIDSLGNQLYMNDQNAIVYMNKQFYYSTNSGQSWDQDRIDIQGAELFPPCIQMNQNNAIIATYQNGIYYDNSNNGKFNFNTNYTIILCTYMVNQSAIAGTTSGLYYSSDYGHTWIQSNISTNKFNSVQMDITGQNCIAGSDSSGLYYSTNYGQTWASTNITSNGFQNLFIDNSNNYFAISIDNKFYYSKDISMNWTTTTYDILFSSIFSIGGNVLTITTSQNQIYYSDNSYNNWKLSDISANSLNPLSINSINMNTNGAAIIATNDGLYYSINNGQSWVPSNIQTNLFRSVSMYGNNCIAGSDTSGIYYSSDAGKNWTQSDLSNNKILFCNMDTSGNAIALGFYYLGMNLFASINNGQTWTQCRYNNAFFSLLVTSFASIFINNGNIITGGTNGIFYYSIVPIQPPIPISNICFPEKTLITTDQGQIHIDKINPTIHTIRNKKIVAITQIISVDDYLICFEKNSIDHNIPSAKTIISLNHKILYNNQMIIADDFVNKFKNVYKIPYNQEVLYNILMEDYSIINVNNLICETLHPNTLIAKLHYILQYTRPEKHNIRIQQFNKLIKKYNIYKV